jgi:hypothetical protein
VDTKLEKIIELNKELSKKVNISLPLIITSLQKTKFQSTGKALISFTARSNSLNNSILNSCINGDIYSAWVTFRPMIEHNFRHLYIYSKALKEDSNSVGSNYYGVLKSSEDLDALNKINNYNNATGLTKTKWNTKGEHNASIKNDAKEFNIEQIFYYLISNGNSDEIIKTYTKEYLLKRLIDYTNLSSAVHGGPFSDLALEEIYKDQDKLNNLIYKYAEDSFTLHKNLVVTTYLFAYTMDESMKEFYEEIK